jgi:hypothetical protein
MASFCVERFGPERLIGLSRDAVNKRSKAFLDLTQCDLRLV